MRFQVPEGADPVEHLDSPRLQTQGSGGARRGNCHVQDAHPKTTGPQAASHCEAGGTGPRDENVGWLHGEPPR